MLVFRSRKRGLIWLSGIAFVFLMMLILYVRGSSSFIIGYNSNPYTKNELADLYWEHKDELKEVAEIILSSDLLRERITEKNDDDWGIFANYDKRYFSEKDWDKIVKLFKAMRPYMIMRSLRAGDDVVYLDFSLKKVDNQEIRTSLFYFKNPETAEYYKKYTWVGELEHLDGYWYIEEQIEN